MSDRYFEYEIRRLKRDIEAEKVSPQEIRRNEANGGMSAFRVVAALKTGGKCFYCGVCAGKKLTADHFIPITLDGADHDDNMFPACQSCNTSKCNMLLEDWRVSLRMKNARTSYGMPSFSLATVQWLMARGFDPLDVLGVPAKKFWFEIEGFETPAGVVVGGWKPSEGSQRWAEEKIRSYWACRFDDFCHQNEMKPSKVLASLKAIDLNPRIFSALKDRLAGRPQYFAQLDGGLLQ